MGPWIHIKLHCRHVHCCVKCARRWGRSLSVRKRQRIRVGVAALGIRHRVLRRKKGVLRTVPTPPHQSPIPSTAPIAIVPQTRRLRSFVSSGWPLAFVAPPDDLA